jgi:hypothetical protein
MLEERRRLRRVVFPFKVSVLIDGEDIGVFHTENVSVGGIRVLSQRRLERNTTVDVVIDLGDRKICSSGRVAWFLDVKPTEQQNTYLYDIGIEFVGIDAAAKADLDGVVGSLQDRSRA